MHQISVISEIVVVTPKIPEEAPGSKLLAILLGIIVMSFIIVILALDAISLYAHLTMMAENITSGMRDIKDFIKHIFSTKV